MELVRDSYDRIVCDYNDAWANYIIPQSSPARPGFDGKLIRKLDAHILARSRRALCCVKSTMTVFLYQAGQRWGQSCDVLRFRHFIRCPIALVCRRPDAIPDPPKHGAVDCTGHDADRQAKHEAPS